MIKLWLHLYCIENIYEQFIFIVFNFLYLQFLTQKLINFISDVGLHGTCFWSCATLSTLHSSAAHKETLLILPNRPVHSEVELKLQSTRAGVKCILYITITFSQSCQYYYCCHSPTGLLQLLLHWLAKSGITIAIIFHRTCHYYYYFIQ